MKALYISASPKKSLSVSDYLLDLQRLFAGGGAKERLRTQGDFGRILARLDEAEAVVFSMPLYVDGVPSHVLAFMQEMEAYCRNRGLAPKVYVLSNGGFIEGRQSRALMQVFANFCARGGFAFGGGIGIGGGVMVNVLRILFLVQAALLVINTLLNGLILGEWLNVEAIVNFVSQALLIIALSGGILWYMGGMGRAIRKGKAFGERYTRILLPAILFVPIANVFFAVISLFQGGLFRGWLRMKTE